MNMVMEATSTPAQRPAAYWPDTQSDNARVRLDQSQLQLLRSLQPNGDGNAMLARFVGLFLDQVPTLVNNLRGALASGDCDELSLAAHTLKSSSANLGAIDLARYAETIEANARRGSLELCAAGLDAFNAEYTRVIPALLRECGVGASLNAATPALA